MIDERKRRILFYVLGLILTGFIILSILIYLFPQSVFDKELSEEIQEHHTPFLNFVMHIVSWFGYMPWSLMVVLATSCLFFVFKYKREALFLLFTLISGLVSSVIKIIVNRPRPAEPFVRIIEKVKYQSFPSGHVLFYVVFFGFLVVLMHHIHVIPSRIRQTTIGVCLFLIFTVPVSRVYVGAHWFTDVLGGFLMGLVCLSIVSYYYLVKAKKF